MITAAVPSERVNRTAVIIGDVSRPKGDSGSTVAGMRS